MNRLLRKGLLATAVCGIAAISMSMGPSAHALSAGAGGGIVQGHVTITAPAGGITTVPSQSQYRFDPITLIGALVTTAPSAYVGCIATDVIFGGFGPGPLGILWPQGGETVLGGTGTVGSFNFGPAPCPGGVPNVGALAGSCANAPAPLAGVGPAVQPGFIRVGPVVLVLLNCTVNGQPASIAVAALFDPPAGQNGVTVGITEATFAGVFAGAGVTVP